MEDPPFRPRALGEIAIRCADLSAMVAFYEDVLGLMRMAEGTRDGIVFFDLGPSFGGHTAVLALFAREAGAGSSEAGERSLHHLALALPVEEQAAAEGWLRARGCEVSVRDFDWAGWRGVFTRDPEGNTVELVASIAAQEEG